MGARIYLIWRGPESTGRDVNMSWTDNDGTSWATPVKLVEKSGSRPYVHASVDEGASRIYFAFNEGNLEDIAGPGVDIYAFYMWNDAGTNRYFKSDGTSIGTDAALPITTVNATQVHNSTSTNDEGQLFNIQHNNGLPIILWGKYVSDFDQKLMYARWTGSAWTNTQIDSMGETISNPRAQGHYTGGGMLDTIDPRTVYYSKVSNKFHHVFKAYTTDNGTTWTSEQISQGNGKNFRPVVPFNRHATEMQVIWLHGAYESYTNYFTSLQCYPAAGAYLDAYFAVKVPSLSASANTTLYMYYDNDDAADQQDAANVFDANAIKTILGDSTWIDNGLVDVYGQALVTVEAGFRFDGTSTNSETIVSNFQTVPAARGFYFRKESSVLNLQGSIVRENNTSTATSFTDLVVAAGNYYGAALRYDSVTAQKLEAFMNGTKAAQSTAVTVVTENDDSANSLYTGRSQHSGAGGGDAMEGYVDYVVISNIARSDAWLKAGTINRGTPNSFWSMASAVDVTAYLQAYTERPNPVTSLAAVAGNGQVALSWTAPTLNVLGGPVAITDYVIQYRTVGSLAWLTFTDGVSATPSATVTGLVNGAAYEFRVAAINSLAAGEYEFITATPFDASALRKQVLQGWS
jgi:hypothetical protein